MEKISACIIAKNEEINIDRCLRSVSWADEIIVVDSGSDDETIEICKRYNCRIVETGWLGFGKTKSISVDSASNDWILSIDADEEVTEELKERILNILKGPEYVGYRIKRDSFYLGRKIDHCGWNNDYPLRLFDKRFGNFNDRIMHEKVIVEGENGRVNEVILHHTYPTIESHVNRINRYSTLGAGEAFGKGKKSTVCGSVLRGMLKFVKMYFIQLGFLDGLHGLILSVNSGYGVYLKYIKLWELHHANEKSN